MLSDNHDETFTIKMQDFEVDIDNKWLHIIESNIKQQRCPTSINFKSVDGIIFLLIVDAYETCILQWNDWTQDYLLSASCENNFESVKNMFASMVNEENKMED